MEIEEVIAGLKALDLSTYPKDEIRTLLHSIGKIASMTLYYHKGKSIMRARVNEDGEHFTKKSQYSFKPQKFNKTYQRASTPNRTMFYATAVPDKPEPGELENMRIIGIAEAVPIMRDLTKSGYQKVSFGRWEVQEDLMLITIIHREDYYKANSFTRELIEAFKDASKDAPADLIEKSLKIQTYLADEFAKIEINADYDYMISAIFSEIAVGLGFDGIFYPSVRTAGQGFNIAITPEATKKLSLQAAGECSLYKVIDHTVVGNDTSAKLRGDEDDEEEFVLEKIVPSSQQVCLEKLGLKSLEELKKI